MGQTKQFIEINGKRYDARTGQLVASRSSVSSTSKPTPHTAPKSAGLDISRPVSSHSGHVHKKPQRSQTLMRGAVKRPVAKPGVKTVKAAHATTGVPTLKSNPLAQVTRHLDIARVKRAEQVKQSKLVSKFGNPAAKAQHPINEDRPVPSRVEPLAVKQAPALATHTPIHAKPKSSEAIIEKGLRNANSHNQTYNSSKKSARKSNKKSRLVSYAAGGMAVFLLAGFMAYQSIPNLSMRYAAARSGIQASVPGYQPSGFTLNKNIEYNPGHIAMEYSSNSDDRQFRITQRETTWNSEALLSNYVATKSDQVQKYEDKGRTIYLYGDNNAAWVNGGIWYDINGDSQLNSDQLIRIATSM